MMNIYLCDLLPSPAIDCGLLTNPANGIVDVSQGTTLGRMATYNCIEEYRLIGEQTRTCEAGGGWSGNAPTCGEFMTCSALIYTRIIY